MEKDRSSKIIAIIALVVAVAGVSLGFAAFSQNLVIQPAAEVKGDSSKFDVQFSLKDSTAETGTVSGTISPEQSDFVKASEANLIATTVSNIKASFTNGKGPQTVAYNFYVYNNGELEAFLKKVTFDKETPECTAKEGTSANLVATACEDVSIKITVDDQNFEASNDAISGKSLSVGEGKAVKVELSYTDTHPVDGDFDVDFGNITLNYSSSDGE